MHYKIFALVLLGLVHQSSQCMCLPKHPQEAFCKAKYVVRARVVSDKTKILSDYHVRMTEMGLDPYESFYTIDVLEIFKNDVLKPMNTTKGTLMTEDGTLVTKLFVAGSTLACDVLLKKEMEYLFTLKLRFGRPTVGLCDWKSEWESVYTSEKMYYGFAGLFDCDCEISTCMNGYCEGNSNCKWPVSFRKKMDLSKFDICIKSSDANCQWMEDNAFPDSSFP